MKTLIILLFLTLSATAKTVDVKDYATPNDGLNDQPGFQLAANALKEAGGGTMLISEGTWDLQGAEINLVGNYLSYKILGNKGAVIRVANNPTSLTFYTGNTNQFEMRDLIFIGGTSGVDTGGILVAHYTQHVIVSGCAFYGVFSNGPMFQTGNVDAVYTNNQFEGSGSNHSIIHGTSITSFRSIVMKNNTFLDYANFKGEHYSKIGEPPAWVRIDAEESGTVNALGGGSLVIDGGRFDEGATTAIEVHNVRNVQIKNIAVNVNGTDPARGILLDNVKYGVVQSSVLGYATRKRPAMVLTRNSQTEVSKLDFGAGVYLGTADSSSGFIITNCVPCGMRPIGGTKGDEKRSPLTRPEPATGATID